ncbi:MAG: FAD-dependent oxidoreductase, partial [Planctomycetota bacterium]|jgi:pyruvate/2-oxoglutarate dehydrogenase complex dihydrolipoamide dehydrogenase (E3) component
MGTEVHLVSRRAVFTDAGPQIAGEMREVLDDEPNLHAHHPASSLAARKEGAGVALDIEDSTGKQTIHADHLLVATGRRADVDGLGLELAGVEIERGKVSCGSDMRTSTPKIFVAGDASGFRLLLHVANWEGQVAGLGAAGVDGNHEVENRLNMSVVFTDPPLALLGMTELEAKKKGIETLSAQARFPETGRAITMDVEHGLWNLVCDPKGEIIGAQILGPRADDLIHILSGIMYYRGTVQDLIDMPWYHPTLSEVLIGLARELSQKVSS